jgi:hypothetical protein
MPRFWLNAPRLFNSLIHPHISFSGKELVAWDVASAGGIPEPTLGLFCRVDGAFYLAMPGRNGAAGQTPRAVPVAVFSFDDDEVVEVRKGALTARRPHK